jgi:hypothetical protein
VLSCLVLAAALAIGCRDSIQEQRKTMATAREAGDLAIEENTVGELSGRRVGVSNIWERTYDRNGAQVAGVAAKLSVLDGKDVEHLVVGLGSRVAIGGDIYECVGIDDGKNDRNQMGEVVLRLVVRR